jgi:ATP-dependent Clp protease ATP-binding subunit ClpC
MLYGCTDRFLLVLDLAADEARAWKHSQVAPEHLLLAMVDEGGGVGAVVLLRFGIEPAQVRAAVEKLVRPGADKVAAGELPLSLDAQDALACATEEAQKLKHTHVGTEHLLLGLLRDERSVAGQALAALGLEYSRACREVISIVGSDTITA